MISVNSETDYIGEEREKNSHQLYWHDLNKTKFLALLSTSSLVLRTCFHPLAVIKTRIQTEKTPVKSTSEMIKKIRIDEGIRRGFYRGYSVALLALLFEPVFMGTLEITRTFLNNNQPRFISISQWDIITSSLSAGTAALIQQSFLGMFYFILNIFEFSKNTNLNNMLTCVLLSFNHGKRNTLNILY
ncbi:unnamed protein product [Rotaria sp. Silwood2]|nr:unnamed protein product [Rotaria sp. Silwood2]CAF4350492.1 unnamed protein product [Rotaria sp. Silwood2]